MKRYLLVAGAGYLGKEIERLAEGDYSVRALTKSGGDGTIACDLSDDASVAEVAAMFPAPEVVVHCASSGRGGVDAYEGVFVRGCRSLRDHFPKSHLVFTSSTSVYHQVDGEEVTEESETRPERETSQLLLKAEETILDAGGCVARLAGIYGEDRSVVYRKFVSGEAVVEEEGQRILNQIHVRDAARAVLFLAERKAKGVFNVSDSRPLSQRETYEGLVEILGGEMPPRGEKNTSRKRAWTHKRVSNAKIAGLGWEPEFASFLDAAREFEAFS